MRQLYFLAASAVALAASKDAGSTTREEPGPDPQAPSRIEAAAMTDPDAATVESADDAAPVLTDEERDGLAADAAELQALSIALRKRGVTIADVLARAAHNAFGVDLR